MNRGVARLALFEKDADYEAFERVLAEAMQNFLTRLTEAIQRLVDLFDAIDQKDKATESRAKLPKPIDGSNK